MGLRVSEIVSSNKNYRHHVDYQAFFSTIPYFVEQSIGEIPSAAGATQSKLRQYPVVSNHFIERQENGSRDKKTNTGILQKT